MFIGVYFVTKGQIFQSLMTGQAVAQRYVRLLLSAELSYC
jgi:hypothetical protein